MKKTKRSHPTPPKSKKKPKQAFPSFPVVGIGASAGGLEAFQEVLAKLSSDTGMAFFLIQHLHPNHKSLLADLLKRETKMSLKEAREGDSISPNHVYLIPADKLMTVKEGKLRLVSRNLTPKEHHPIDIFFQSLSEEFKNLAIGIVLSGNGKDGTQGLEAIKAQGGLTFAQEPESALFSEMPQNAIRSGEVDFILPTKMIAKELSWIASHPQLFEIPIVKPAISTKEESKDTQKALETIFELLRSRVQVDFSAYKPTTLQRRISRRMVFLKKNNLKTYVAYLKSHPGEIDELFSDFLINVTSFFRDEEIYSVFREQLFPRLVENRAPDSTIRIWVPACSSGEELYSIALCLLDYLEEKKLGFRLQLFGSDISEPSLARARRGVYSLNETKQIPPKILERFFQKVPTGYKINKLVRDMCLFSRHDVTTDPPFSKIDFISCRNLLIYLTPALQEEVLSTFHYALNPNGFLCLGKSENLGSASIAFETVSKLGKIFSKKMIQTKTGNLGKPRRHHKIQMIQSSPLSYRHDPEFSKEADRILFERFGPGAVVVDGNLDIVLFRGRTYPYLRQSSGPATLNLFKLCDPALSPELRRLTQKIKEEPNKNQSGLINFGFSGKVEKVRVDIIPIPPNSSAPTSHFLIVFSKECPSSLKDPKKKAITQSRSKTDQLELLRNENSQLVLELATARDYQESILRESEASREVSAIAYEELESSNEELQSTNEELQTAKEELQSTNEELVTVNDELESRNTELGHLNNDLTNLLSVIEVPIVMVDNQGKIRRFTPRASKLFHLIPGDIGRPLEDIKIELTGVKIESFITEIIENLSVKEIEVQDSEGHWYRLQGRPYKTLDHKIEGAVIALFDIHAIKGALIESRNALEQANSIINTVNLPLLVVDSSFNLVFANQSFLRTYGLKESEIQKTFLKLFQPGGKAISIAEQLLELSQSRGEVVKLHLDCELPPGKPRELLLTARALSLPEFNSGHLLLSVEDITEIQEVVKERKRLLVSEQEAREEAEQANRTKDLFLATLSHELRTPLTSILMWSQLLKTKKLAPEKMVTALDTIEQSAKLQAQLIDELLDITRVSSGKVMIEKRVLDAHKTLNSALDSIRPSADTKGLKFDFAYQAKSAQVEADPSRLRQVFLNLLSNAVKFTPNGGTIRVGTQNRTVNDQSFLEVSFQDTGKGLNPLFIPHIFNPFTQADSSTTRTEGGLGLGLFIVRNLVELQGGKVTASSPGEGQGSTFILSFPVAPHGAAKAESSNQKKVIGPEEQNQNERVDLSGLNLLYVDDEELNRESIAEGLTLLGATVRLASSVKQALKIFTEMRPHVLITDLGMPEEDGFSLLHKVRSLSPQEGGNTPAIALTAYASVEDKVRTQLAGFQAHLSKPLEIETLSQTIRRLMPIKGNK